jgi:hypothetical protein
MVRKLSFLLLSSALAAALSATSALAGDASSLSSVDQAALAQTQALLQSSSLLKDYDKGNSAPAVEAIQKLTKGDAKTQAEIQSLSAEIFASLVQETQGDPAKLEELLLQAQKDPLKFEAGLTAAQKAQLHSIAGEIDSKK